MSKQTSSAPAQPDTKPTPWTASRVTQTPIGDLVPYAQNSRTHSQKQIAQIKASVARFGFVTPILMDGSGVIIAGHGRFEAAKALGMASVPTVVADHLTPAEVRALRIADNRLAELSEWDRDALQIEFADLMDLTLCGELDLDLEITGFEMPQIDLLISGDAAPAETETAPLPERGRLPVSRPDDLWQLGDHRLLCADALDPQSYERLLGGEMARLVFTDPPYNVPVNGHVRSGEGGHREFAMASGEMSPEEFRDFLSTMFARLNDRLVLGGIAMVCMDWRHIEELIATGKGAGFDLLNLCVWNKSNGGMGSLYRSKHELVAIFKKPSAAHVNNIELGRHGRNRTNVWDYAGVNSFGAGREADLADHPTVKPTALVADALMDVSERGDLVLDAFGGSGATLLAAERVGRRAGLIELDPAYVDVAIRRWEAATGRDAIRLSDGQNFKTAAAAQKLDWAEVCHDETH